MLAFSSIKQYDSEDLEYPFIVDLDNPSPHPLSLYGQNKSISPFVFYRRK